MGRRAGTIILLLLFFLSSCAGKREGGGSGDDSGSQAGQGEARQEEPAVGQADPGASQGGREPAPADAGNGTGAISLRPTDQGGGTPSSRQTQPGEAQPQARPAGTLSEQLFTPYLPDLSLFPEDMVIGPLQDTAAKGEVQPLISIAETFLGGLRDGKLADDVILPEQRETLRRSLSDPLSKKYLPVRWRLGAVSLSADTARANVRLYGNPGVTVGELLFRKDAEGNWYLEDLTADLSLLLEPYEEREEAYEPSAYSWIGQ